MAKKKVFISYSRKDREFVEGLISSLVEHDLEVWFDKHMKSGADWDDALEEQIMSNDHMVIVLSETSAASDNVKNEMRFALDLGKRIHPILYKPCSVPLSMRRMHYIDFTTIEYDDAVQLLVNDINGAPMKEGSVHKTFNKKTPWKPIFIGALAVIAIVFGVWKFWPTPEEVIKPIVTELDEIKESIKIDTATIVEPPSVVIPPWDTRIYKSNYDRSNIPEDMSENDVWKKISKDEENLFEGLLYYFERYGNESNYRDIALGLILKQFDKEGYAMYEEPSTGEGPFFKPYLYLDLDGENYLIKVELIDRQPKSGDLVVGVRDRVAPIYSGILGIHDEISMIGSLGKDQMAFIMPDDDIEDKVIKGFGNNLYFKVKYRDYE